MDYEKFEAKVERLIEEYDSDDDRKHYLKDFLLEATNAEFIGSLYVECGGE